MGASGWSIFTPYRDDIEQALREAQERVFANREYGDPVFKNDPEFAAPGTAGHVGPVPRTIDDLRNQVAENGTHSIIDIYGVSDGPDFGTAFPMPQELMLELYGTDRPTRAHVEAKALEASEQLDRWQCFYAIVYESDKPVEIYFEGCSGD